MDKSKLQRLINHYFSDPERQITVPSGHILLHQSGFNDRLYWVKSGELEGFFSGAHDDHKTKVFTAPTGTFIGVHSFFAETLEASTTVIAKEQSELAWIDTQTQAMDIEQYGPLTAQFTPVIVKELARRQMRASLEAVEREKMQTKLYAAQQMTILGQLAAGIAHELNNAVGVFSSKTARLQDVIVELLEASDPNARQFLDQGLRDGQTASSATVRAQTQQLEDKYRLTKNLARRLARANPEGELNGLWLSNTEQALRYWEIGRDLHDMRLAASHSVDIVKSVKQLGRSDTDTEELLDVNDTLHKALALLHNNLRGIEIKLQLMPLPKIHASVTELVQIWLNIIKNSSDALRTTTGPCIVISTAQLRNMVVVSIENNGPEIDKLTLQKIFQPNFTTKKGGLSFGLGLGLSIVQRIVHSYGGSIVVNSNTQATMFTIKLPLITTK